MVLPIVVQALFSLHVVNIKHHMHLLNFSGRYFTCVSTCFWNKRLVEDVNPMRFKDPL